jgi:hypothetical protein
MSAQDKLMAAMTGAKIPSADETYEVSVPDIPRRAVPKPVEEKIVEIVPNNAMLVNEDGTISMGNYTLTGVGLVINPEATLDEWREVGRVLSRLDASIQWLIGDWFVYGESKYGDAKAIAEQLGYSHGTIRVYASVARNVELLIRINNLSFAHHQLVAAKSQEEQRQWLKRAVAENLSVAALRKLINGDDDPNDDPDPDIAEANRVGVKTLRKAQKWDKPKRNKAALLHEEIARQLREMD